MPSILVYSLTKKLTVAEIRPAMGIYFLRVTPHYGMPSFLLLSYAWSSVQCTNIYLAPYFLLHSGAVSKKCTVASSYCCSTPTTLLFASRKRKLKKANAWITSERSCFAELFALLM